MDPENPEKKTDSAPGIPQIEEAITEFWEQNGIFEKSLNKTKDGAPYTFYDGPPFATGLPHYGHILASTIKDLIPRYQTMRGHFVRRRWGWDCHGLPIEALVEKKLEISGKKQIEEIGIQKFNETCRSMVLQYVEEWGKMVRRMGRWVDFENSYKTMDLDYMESVWWAFKQVYDKGLAYEGRKVLLYCPRCETPISNFEVAMDNSYQDVTEESVYVKFKVRDEENTYFLAWTTTPWTLPGNVALAVGNDIDYVKAKIGNNIFIAAKALTEKVLPAGYEVVAEMKGKNLVGLSYEPLYKVDEVAASDKAFKVYAADFVTIEDGTDIVHTAVVYGEDDYQLGLREDLPIVPLLDEKGHFNDQAPALVRGQYFKKADKIIKEDLESRKPTSLILKRETSTHSYPHCWRCNTALYYNAIPAWFINIQKIKKDLLKTNEKHINWFPEHLKHGRYQKSVEAAPDWNISRNRYWGNPIPVWRCEKCGKNTVAGSLEDIKARSVKKNQFLFVRHGEASHNVAGLCGPASDASEYASRLTEKGKLEAEEIGKSLQGQKIDLILASPLARIQETVAIIKKHVNAPVEVCEELRELNPGSDHRSIAEWEAAEAKEEDPIAFKFPGGESHADAKARLAKLFRAVDEKYSGKTILIATHGGLLWMAQSLLQGLSNKETMHSQYPATGKVFDFQWSPLPFNDRGEVDLHRPYIDEVVLKCDCGGEMRRTPEIFDSWVEAGSMPFSEYHYPFENKELFESRFPAQFVAEYIAQTRAWFYVMHVMSQIIFGKAPFENVVTTGNILAEDGTKMSKSKNNYPDPWLVIDKYGVDTLRFYLMNSVVMEADNVDFSQKDVESIHRKVTMILWNVQQYFVTYTKQSGWQAGSENAASTHILDRWILARAKELVTGVTDHLDAYNTVRASRVIMSYIDDLSTWYLRRSRGREDTGFFPTFRQALVTVAQVTAPFMPHIAEAVYRNVRSEKDAESVHLTDWPVKEELSAEEKKLLEDMGVVRQVASMVLATRKSLNAPVRQPLARMDVMGLKGEPIQLAPEIAAILLSEVNVKELASIDKDTPGIEKSADEKYILFVDMNLTDDLKLEGEVRKLERAIQEKRKEMGLKVGEMARLTYSAADAATEAAFKAIDIKKTYISEIKKGAGTDGTFEIEKMA